MKGQLIFRDKNEQLLKSTEITKLPLIIGRSKECDIVLDSIKISKKHAMLFLQNDDLFLKDLGSSNGLMLGAFRVDQVQLTQEPRCTIGDIEVEYVRAKGSETTQTLQTEKIQSPSPPPQSHTSDGSDLEFKTIVRPRKVPEKVKAKALFQLKLSRRLLYVFMGFFFFVVLSIAVILFYPRKEFPIEGYSWYTAPSRKSFLSTPPVGISQGDFKKKFEELFRKSIDAHEKDNIN